MTRKHYILWLRTACIMTIFTGFVSLFAAHPAGAEAWRFLFDLLLWPVDNNPAAFGPMEQILSAVLGGVMIGWGAMMFFLCRAFDESSNETVRQALLFGLMIWYVTDSAGSFVSGIPGNVVLNTSFLILFLIPIVGLKNK